MATPQPIYFRQVEAGPMANYVYLIGDPKTRVAAIVDPAWEVQRLVDLAQADGYELRHILLTHYHPDHLGGDFMGTHIDGAVEVLGRVKAKLYAHKAEVPWVRRLAGLASSDVVAVESGDTASLGELNLTFIHTPGHTPGSQCFMIDRKLISGDTLFIGGCGRVDLPGADPAQMYHSLNHILRNLADDTVVYPGHAYAPQPSSTIGEEKRANPYMRFDSLAQFLAAMGVPRAQ
ncbi:MAG TPA: MBL fold metallo-hydrolase [Candidatus Binataceae bacterium]|nr:MBL fold metallo-hydrolase [Candidatus Binataceae bacterium]